MRFVKSPMITLNMQILFKYRASIYQLHSKCICNSSNTKYLYLTSTIYPIGNKPAKLFVVKTHGTQSILAVSSRSWLSYTYQSRFHLTPLSYESLEYASGFSSEQCPEGLVAISSNSLRILALQKLGTNFNQASVPLQYTPRRFCLHPPSNRFSKYIQ